MRSKMQGDIAWLAMAMQVSTRLWLGATLSTHRNLTLIEALIQKVRTCTLCRPLLFASDGLQAYLHAIRAVFREPVPTGRRGHPRLRPWDGIYITQVVKQYAIDSRFIPRLRWTAPSAVRCEPVLDCYQTYGMRRYFTCAIYSSYPASSARSVRSSCTARNATPTTRISPMNTPIHDPSKMAVPTRKMIAVAYIGWRT